MPSFETEVVNVAPELITEKPTKPLTKYTFMDLSVDGIPRGRVVFELYADKCPLAAENFRCLCTGEKNSQKGTPLWYKDTHFHSIVKDWVMVGGDVENDNGTGGETIYGKYFDDEPTVSHDGPGILSAMSFKNHTNNSQFFISLQPATWLDVQHVGFGRVISGLPLLQECSAYSEGDSGVPTKDVRISCCGEIHL